MRGRLPSELIRRRLKPRLPAFCKDWLKAVSVIQNFLEWKVYVKAKDDADDTYELKLEGTDQKENGLFGSIALYDEKYPAATWYTVKLTATDKAGNQTTVTKDVYKDESSPVPEIVEPDFRIQRPEYQSYTVPQFVLPDTAESLSLTASWPRTFTLGSADWYVNNKKRIRIQPHTI